MKQKISLTGLLSGAALLLAVSTASATTFDAASAFSSSNPSGPWTYGSYSTANTPGSFVAFNQYTANFGSSGLDFHNISGDQDGVPAVFHNGTASAISWSTLVLPAGGIALHPGDQGERAVIRFTAPTTGYYSISANFFGWDNGPTTTDVHVDGGSSFNFSGVVNGFSLTNPFATYSGGPALLTAGSIVDFSVGKSGSIGDTTYYNDTTGLSAQITVPDGGLTAMLIGMGMLGLGAVRRKLM